MSDIMKLEAQIEDMKDLMKVRDDVLKLSENPEFKRIIREEYLVQEAARFVYQSADPNLDANMRADALAMAQATGHLKRWLNARIIMGNNAEQSIPAINEEIEQLRVNGEDE